MDKAKDSLKSFFDAMEEMGADQACPLVTVDNREGNSSQEHEELVARINEQPRDYARKRSHKDTNNSAAGKSGASNDACPLRFWPCGWCRKEYDFRYQCCPSPGCPGIILRPGRDLVKAQQQKWRCSRWMQGNQSSGIGISCSHVISGEFSKVM